MSTRGVVDLVFCIDVSTSMQPCLDAVRRHIGEFVRGLSSNPQQLMDLRLDFLAHNADQDGEVFGLRSMRLVQGEMVESLYRRDGAGLFTTDVAEFQHCLETVTVLGDEAVLVALDCVLDFPWRPRNKCHRVVICLTDEPLETNAALALQQAALPAILDKIEALGVMLFLVGPESAGFHKLSEVDKSEYQVVDRVSDGLRSVAFDKVLSYIGKSLSMAAVQSYEETPVRRALFDQDKWGLVDAPMRGR